MKLNKNTLNVVIFSILAVILSSCAEQKQDYNTKTNVNSDSETNVNSDSETNDKKNNKTDLDESILINSESGVDMDTSNMSDEEYAKFQATRFVDTANLLASQTKDDDIKNIVNKLADQISSKGAKVSYSEGVFKSEKGINYTIIFSEDKVSLGNTVK